MIVLAAICPVNRLVAEFVAGIRNGSKFPSFGRLLQDNPPFSSLSATITQAVQKGSDARNDEGLRRAAYYFVRKQANGVVTQQMALTGPPVLIH